MVARDLGARWGGCWEVMVTAEGVVAKGLIGCMCSGRAGACRGVVERDVEGKEVREESGK